MNRLDELISNTFFIFLWKAVALHINFHRSHKVYLVKLSNFQMRNCFGWVSLGEIILRALFALFYLGVIASLVNFHELVRLLFFLLRVRMIILKKKIVSTLVKERFSS